MKKICFCDSCNAYEAKRRAEGRPIIFEEDKPVQPQKKTNPMTYVGAGVALHMAAENAMEASSFDGGGF